MKNMNCTSLKRQFVTFSTVLKNNIFLIIFAIFLDSKSLPDFLIFQVSMLLIFGDLRHDSETLELEFILLLTS